VTYESAGTYTTTLQNAAGCDSILTTILNITPAITQNVNYTICPGNVVYYSTGSGTIVEAGSGAVALPDGNIYSSAGTYSINLQNANGCDSIYNIVLDYAPTLTGSQSLTICSGNMVYISTESGTVVMAASGAVTPPGGVTYESAGTYTTTLQNAAGCDSLLTTILNITPAITQNVNYTVCPGNVVYYSTGSGTIVEAGSGAVALPDGNIYSSAGTYSINLQNANGCDSIYNIVLDYAPTLTGSQSLTICSGNMVYISTESGTVVMAASGAVTPPGGVTYEASGTYTTTLQNANGCDSILTTNITVTPAFTHSASYALCPGNVIYYSTGSGTVVEAGLGAVSLPDGAIYSSAGSYDINLQNANGCDSVYTISISYVPAITASQTVLLCDSQMVYISSASGTVVLAVTDTTAPGGHIYTEPGIYLDTLSTFSGCDSLLTTTIVACSTVARRANPTDDMNTIQNKDKIALLTPNASIAEMKVYPNPARDVATVVFTMTYEDPEITLSLMDMKGNLVLSATKSMNGSTEGAFKFNVSQLASGTYYIHLLGAHFNQTQKLEVINH
jgi:formylmethanofuran dehydrogenase subunit D